MEAYYDESAGIWQVLDEEGFIVREPFDTERDALDWIEEASHD